MFAAYDDRNPVLGMHRRELERRIIRNSKPSKNVLNIELTKRQEQAIDFMTEFENGPEMSMLLTGHAGTGKTTTVGEYLKHTDKNVVLVAPTNKAVRVLCETAGNLGVSAPCMTVHKLLDLMMHSDDSEKYCAKRENAKNLIAHFDVVIIDECSMIGNMAKKREEIGLYDRLVTESRLYGTKLIFVGDKHQLPPVKEANSPTLDINPHFKLTKIVRQAADNPIIQTADWLRRKQDGEDCGQCPEPRLVNGCGVHSIGSKKEYEDLVLSHFRENDSADFSRAVAYRWACINPFARRIANALFPEHEGEQYIVGMRYFTTEPVLNLDDSINGPLFHMITDEDAVLRGIEECENPDRRFGNYRTLKLRFKKDEEDGGEEFNAYVVHPEEEIRFRRDVMQLKAAAIRREVRWTHFWGTGDAYNFDLDEKRLCSRLKPYYVTTVHRSQGSTYQNVFVDYSDISCMRDNMERLRCLYTACTRGAKNLFVFEGE
jgi:ATP-dependent exoDNAse (exonuclease V) alpha subunit